MPPRSRKDIDDATLENNVEVVPVKVDIWLKSGAILSSVQFFKNYESLDDDALCNKSIQENSILFDSSGCVGSVTFGSLIVDANSIAAIRYSPFRLSNSSGEALYGHTF